MSSYKQLSNQGPPLLPAGASKSRDKRRPISGAISTGHRHRCPPTTHTHTPPPLGSHGLSSRFQLISLFCLQNEKFETNTRHQEVEANSGAVDTWTQISNRHRRGRERFSRTALMSPPPPPIPPFNDLKNPPVVY